MDKELTVRKGWVNNMHAFVINLAASTARREKMKEILDRQKSISYEFIPAVDGRVLSKEQLDSLFDIETAEQKCMRKILPGEIGCTLSHQKCFKEIIDRNMQYALVLEDDIEITAPLECVFPDIEELLATEKPRIVLLSGWNYFTKKRRLNAKYLITKIIDGYLTHAYVINAAAAKLMITKRPDFLADDWRCFIKHGVEILGIRPHLINQCGDFSSDVTNGGLRFKFSKGFIKRYARKAWHLLFKIAGHYEKADKDYVA